jgi:hypothetical protein
MVGRTGARAEESNLSTIACATGVHTEAGREEAATVRSSVQPHGVGEWVQGSVIRPLTNADNIWADKNSRAELNLGSARLRIDSETSLTLTNVK